MVDASLPASELQTGTRCSSGHIASPPNVEADR
jgi:hypothetical protein